MSSPYLICIDTGKDHYINCNSIGEFCIKHQGGGYFVAFRMKYYDKLSYSEEFQTYTEAEVLVKKILDMC